MRNSPLSRLVTIAVLAVALGNVPFAWGQYTETTIHNFTGGNDGAIPYSGLIFDAQGNLYGTTNQGGPYGEGSVFRLSPQSGGGWAETVLYDFSGGTDGGLPYGELAVDAQGNLYGNTQQGGSASCVFLYGAPCGVVFKLSPQAHSRWKETVLHAFQSNARDGFLPSSGLVFDAAGNAYGNTVRGGAYNAGVVFESTPTASGAWKEKILHSFSGGSDGGSPGGQLIVDAAGNLYGTTEEGGNVNTATCTIYGCGVVLKLAPASGGRWNEQVIYSFTNTGDGEAPSGGLTSDAAGNLYGTAYGGNSTNCLGGSCGVVFEVSKDSGRLWTEKVLYNFQGGNDGWSPNANVIFDTTGNLYGTTYWGGGATICAPFGCGTVFELSPSSGGNWTESILYTFTGGADGCRPEAALVEDSAGNFYSTVSANGTACVNGALLSGAVFELTP